MGGCVSCGSESSSSLPAFNNVRVVHLNGYVEDFVQPVSVKQLTGDPPKHFVCTTLQLLSSSNLSKPLRGDTQLQRGQVYFKLPCSVLQADVSPVDLAFLAKRLTAIAKTTAANASRGEEGSKPLLEARTLSSHLGLGWSPNARVSVSSASGVRRRRSPYDYGVRLWKPNLDTIGESSFSQRSE